jgi:hypothetical protein
MPLLRSWWEENRRLPTNVGRFEVLMYFTVAVYVVVNALHRPPIQAPPIVQILAWLVSETLLSGILLLWTWAIARRHKNWARWALLIVYVLSLRDSIRFADHLLAVQPIVGCLQLSAYAAEALAVFFIFTGDARSYFAQTQSATIQLPSRGADMRKAGRALSFLKWVGFLTGFLIWVLASLMLFYFYLSALELWLGSLAGSIVAFIIAPGLIVFPLVYWFVEGLFPSTYFILLGVIFAGALMTWICRSENA